MKTASIFEYLPKYASAIYKLAGAEERKEVKSPALHALGTVGSGLLGMAGGTLAGYGAATLADKLHQKATGTPIPMTYLLPASSLLGAGLGLAYSKYKTHEREELERALQSHRNRAARGVSE